MSQLKLKLPKINATKNLSIFSAINNDRKENLMIREAIKNGHLIYPTHEFIWTKFKNQIDFNQRYVPKKTKRKSDNYEVTSEELNLIIFLNMSNERIVELGDLCLCVNLKILNLSSNHLVNVDALSSCVNLFRLDLQNNQILNLPDKEFWSLMTQLKILFLHGNPLGRLEYLKYLSACPCLEVLTMYDTPISIKYNYRHHAVNSIVTLKALDEYVISDEEIIEEADFNNIFKTKSQALKIHLSIAPAENVCYKSELKATHKLLKKINQKIAHYSPVHILQKYVRGFLTRNRRLIKHQDLDKAARIIQHWWRKKQAIRKHRNIDLAFDIFKSSESELPQPGKNTVKSASFSHHSATTTIMDENFRTSNNNSNVHSKLGFPRTETDLDTLDRSARKRNIIIDLNKLGKFQSSLFEVSDSKFSGLQTQSNREFQRNDHNDHSKFISVSRLMSMIKENLDNKENNKIFENLTNDPEMKDIIRMHNFRKQLEAEEKFTEFRLPMLMPRSFALSMRDNFVIDLVREKHLGANSIKLMENEIHAKMNEMRQEIKQVVKEPFITNDQRFFQKAFGNMSLGCLRAVDKAYEDRALVDKKLAVQKKADKLREINKYSHDRVDYYKDDRIKETQAAHKIEVQLVEKSRIRLDQEYDDLKERVQEERQKRIDLNKNRRKDIKMAIEFSKQHLSVSKALSKHEHLTSKETNRTINNEFVTKLKTNNEKQRDLVRKYTSQRNILRLIQSTNDRGLIERKIKENIEDNEFNARSRVDKLRSLEFKGFTQQSITGRTTRIDNPTNIVNLLYNFRPLSIFREMESDSDISHVLVPENTNYDLKN